MPFLFRVPMVYRVRITGSIRIKEEEKIIYILTEIKTDGTCRVISVWEEDGSQR